MFFFPYELIHFSSAVLVRSLRQSRERWLLSTFPKFSTKARPSKSNEGPPPPPPHTIQTRGRCDVEIGPHTFSDTIFYEVHYLSTQLSAPSSSNTRPYQTSWKSVTPYGSTYLQSTPVAPAAMAATLATPSRPSMDSSALASVSPALINQVNSAASSNPILANLLQVAAGGNATDDQLRTLGLLIQSLASRESVASPATQPPPPNTNLPSSLFVTQPPIKPFDVVVEFREMPNERWLFPRGPTVCERILDNVTTGAAYDIILTTCIPFAKTAEATTSSTTSSTPATTEQPATESQPQPEKTPQAVKMILKKAPFTVWDTLYRWTGGEQEMSKHREYLQNLVGRLSRYPHAAFNYGTQKGPKRAYLGYQLLDGSLLAQLQAVSTYRNGMHIYSPCQYRSPKMYIP